MNFQTAIREYRKMNFVSSYGQFYGRKPALQDMGDIDILKTQKFSK
jgi:hypothetical protein